jgi:hypothetical protein
MTRGPVRLRDVFINRPFVVFKNVASYALLAGTVLLPIAWPAEAADVSVLEAVAVSPLQTENNSAPTLAQSQDPSTSNPPEPQHKRIFGLIPNYRTSPDLKNYKPLTAKEKLTIAWHDCFDYGTFILGAAFGAEAQIAGANPSFGSGVPAYFRYAGASYTDWAVGDVMTEGIYPAILHEDPRYFRRGEGGGWSRLGYAVGQIFWTHTDSGTTQFNFSEIAGNGTAVAISNIYYPDDRTVAHNASKLLVQLGVDMAGNVLKEFSPDLTRRFSRKHRTNKP